MRFGSWRKSEGDALELGSRVQVAWAVLVLRGLALPLLTPHSLQALNVPHSAVMASKDFSLALRHHTREPK